MGSYLIRSKYTAVRYRDEILMPHLLPVINIRREVFQHDNARPHTARITTDFLEQQNVTVGNVSYRIVFIYANLS